MSSISSINREIKYMDKELHALKGIDSSVRIYRKSRYFVHYDLDDGSVLLHARDYFHHILSLTHDWSRDGTPVSWGLEPILGRLREIDNHNHDVLARIHEENERKEQLRRRASVNEFKAGAYDMRRDFARAVNDVNTSTLEKVESRRKKDAYCK